MERSSNKVSNCDSLVIGGGFKGMMTAYGLLKQSQDVVLLDKAPELGGFMKPIKWDDIWIDRGPQFLDAISESQRRLLDDITGPDSKLDSIEYSYASFWNDVLTPDFAIPDYRTLPTEAQAMVLLEALSAPPRNETATNLAEEYQHALPCTYKYIDRWCQKFLNLSAEELSPTSASLVTFVGRKLLLENDRSLELKQSPVLDELIAAQKKSISHDTYNLYPLGSNLGKFADLFVDKLQQLGLKSVLGVEVRGITPTSNGYLVEASNDVTIEATQIYFATAAEVTESILFETSNFQKFIQPVSQLFYYCELSLEQDFPSYVMDYSESSVTRVTNLTAYSNHTSSDKSIICVEVPTEMTSQEWQAPADFFEEKISGELKAIGIDTQSIQKRKEVKLPQTYRAMRSGYDNYLQSFTEKVGDLFDDTMHILTPHTLTRAKIMQDLQSIGVLDAGDGTM